MIETTLDNAIRTSISGVDAEPHIERTALTEPNVDEVSSLEEPDIEHVFVHASIIGHIQILGRLTWLVRL